jgi:hypothetical protein
MDAIAAGPRHDPWVPIQQLRPFTLVVAVERAGTESPVLPPTTYATSFRPSRILPLGPKRHRAGAC